jgi:hypothetical protein
VVLLYLGVALYTVVLTTTRNNESNALKNTLESQSITDCSSLENVGCEGGNSN